MPTKKSADDIREYFRSVFDTSYDLGPRKWLQLRAQFLGVASSDTESDESDPQELFAKRAELESQIARIRRAFWTWELPELRKSLQSLDCSQFPDLHDAVAKLKRTARYRTQFPQLVQHRHFQPELFQAFKQIVILSPKEAAPIKEKLLSQIRRDRLIVPVLKMVDVIQAEFPDLFQLEPEWFTLVRAN